MLKPIQLLRRDYSLLMRASGDCATRHNNPCRFERIGYAGNQPKRTRAGVSKDMTRREVNRFSSVVAILVGMFASIVVSAAWAGDIENFYGGKTVTVLVGFEPGGGYDLYARLIGSHLGRHIPGRPNVVVKNMPGVGGIKAANFLQNNAERDGTVLGVTAQAVALEQRLGNPAVRYDAAGFNWIGRVTDNVELTVVWHSAPVKTIQDAFEREVVISATSAGALSAQLPTALNVTAGTKFKLVMGYPGSTGAMLAMERGEVEGSHAAWPTLKTAKAAWLRDHLIRILVQYAPTRHPEIPDAPSMVELARPGNDHAAAALLASSAAIGRSLMAPPGVPEARIAALRTAFQAMVKDLDFLAEIKKRRADFNPLDGASLARLIGEALSAPDEVAKLAKDAKTVAR